MTQNQQRLTPTENTISTLMIIFILLVGACIIFVEINRNKSIEEHSSGCCRHICEKYIGVGNYTACDTELVACKLENTNNNTNIIPMDVGLKIKNQTLECGKPMPTREYIKKRWASWAN